MDEEATPTAWEDIGGVVPAAARSTPALLSSQTVSRIEREDFAKVLTPCLALTSGVGMTAGDQRLWLNAAYAVLRDVPVDRLKPATRIAMRTADHPSKIVPAIVAALDAERARYRAAGGRPAPALPPPTETEAEKVERLEVAGLMAGLVKRLSARDEVQQG